MNITTDCCTTSSLHHSSSSSWLTTSVSGVSMGSSLLLATLRRWHLAGWPIIPLVCSIMRMTHLWSRLMDWKSCIISLTTSTTSIPTSNSPWRLSQTATSPSWTLTYAEDRWFLGAHCVQEAHPHQPASEWWVLATPEQFLNSKVSQDWNSSVVHWNRMAMVTGRSVALCIYLRQDTPREDLILVVFCPLLGFKIF